MKKIKFALIGTGQIAHTHAKAIKSLPNCELVAVRGSNEAHTKNFAGLYNIKPYTDYDALLENENIDAVDIVAINSRHADFGIKAAQRKKHVLVEKPIDVSVKKAEKLISECRLNNVKLSVISQYRFNTALQLAKKLVQDGKLGKNLYSKISVRKYRPDSCFNSSAWKKSKAESGGGVLIINAIHYIDVLLWIMGSPSSVYCSLHESTPGIEDIGLALIKFENNSFGIVESTNKASMNMPDKLEINCEDGSIAVEGKRITQKVIGKGTISSILNSKISKISSIISKKDGKIIYQIRDFADSILKNRSPFVTGEDGLKTLKLIQAMYESAHLKKEVIVK